MLTRRAAMKAMSLFGLGRTVPPRVGAGLSDTGAAVSVAPATGNVIRARYVIIFGPGGGWFIYNGTPAAGNPPVAWGTQAAKDPYGNTLPVSGGVFDQNSGFIAGLLNGGIYLNAPGNYTQATLTAALGGLDLQSPVESAADVPANLALLSKARNGGLIPLVQVPRGTQLEAPAVQIPGGAAPAAVAGEAVAYVPATGGGQLAYVDGSGASYDTGRATGISPGQVVTATVLTALTGLSVQVGVGTYHFRGEIQMKAQVAAGVWSVGLAGPAESALNYAFSYVSRAGVTATFNNQGAYNSALNGPNPMVASDYTIVVAGTVTTTAAGSLELTGATTAGVDTWTIFSGSTFEAFPVA